MLATKKASATALAIILLALILIVVAERNTLPKAPMAVFPPESLSTGQCLDPCPKYNEYNCDNMPSYVCQWSSSYTCEDVRPYPSKCSNQKDRASCEDNSTTLCCWDGDGDGYPLSTYLRCVPNAWSIGDCNDSNPNIPGIEGYTVPGVCSDGLDNDCDGNIDCKDSGCKWDPACMYTLKVSVVGLGNVTDSTKEFINCPTYTCEASFPQDTKVTLNATSSVTEFNHWEGDCSGHNTICTLTMDGNKTVTANFSSYCGNNIAEEGEECDGTDLPKRLCTDLKEKGYTGGELSCTSDCKYNESNCVTGGQLYISFVDPTPSNNSKLNRNWVYINITSNKELSTAILEWNGTNYTMSRSGSGTNWYLNKTSLTNRTYSYKVFGKDFTNNWNVSETRIVTINVEPCSGSLNLNFVPNPATKNHKVIANVSGLSNCNGNIATFSCSSAQGQQISIPSCKYSNSEGCTSTFTAPSKTGTYDCTANVSGKSASVFLSVVDCVRQNPMLIVEPSSQKGGKGDSLLYTVTAGNNNTCDSTFNLSVMCYSNKWDCELLFKNEEHDSLNLDITENDSENVTLIITSPSGASVNSYNHTLQLYDIRDDSKKTTTDVEYEVAICNRKNPKLEVKKSKQPGEPGQERVYAITIKNLDRCSSYYTLNLSCEKNWTCNLIPSTIYLLDGKSTDFKVELTSAKGAELGEHNFSLTATNYFDENLSASTILTYEVLPFTASQSIEKQILGQYVIGDGYCDAILGETAQNSPKDCAPPKAETKTPVCGNNIVEVGEDCDGASASLCPGLCVSCKCPFIIGDNICDTSAGESEALSIDCAKKTHSNSIIILIAIIFAISGGAGYYFIRRRGLLSGLAAAHGVEAPAPGVDLEPAINNMLSEGYSPQEIHSSLEASGWPHSKIDAAMTSVQQDLDALGKLAVQQGVATPTEKAKATRYVKKCLALGYDPTQIRTALLSSGWPEDVVDSVISKQTAAHIKSHAESAGVAKPSDDIHALKEYVKKELNEGHTKQDIKKVLESAGWSDSDIKEAFGE